MSTDIRRMSREELDALNEDGRLWRNREKLASGSAEEEAGQASNDSFSASSTSGKIGEQLELW